MQQAQSPARFIPRFVNGFHVVFDRWNFSNVATARTAKACAVAAAELNAGKEPARARRGRR